jgi:hypothetical protein
MATEIKTLEQKILSVQMEAPSMIREKEGYGYKYFDINQIIESLKPLFAKHGLLVIQPLTHIDGKPAIDTRVISSDKELSFITPLPTNSTKKTYTSKAGHACEDTETDPQKMGAVITYYRRYALQSLFLLQAEDTDGVVNGVTPEDFI